MTDPLAYIETAHKHAEQTAQAVSAARWFATAVDARAKVRASFITPEDPGALAAFFELAAPETVLRRIAADRKTLAEHRAVECKEFACDCDDCCAACRWTESRERGTEPASGYPDPHIYPCPTVRNMAEGWGWTGETT